MTIATERDAAPRRHRVIIARSEPAQTGFTPEPVISMMNPSGCTAGEAHMFSFSKRTTVVVPEGRLRCSSCGSDATAQYGASGRHYCYRCSRFFQDAPGVAFDLVADGWTPGLGALQAAGEVIAVPLRGGFYGVCVLQGYVAFGGRKGGAVRCKARP
jgi:hypothetical protein